MKFKKSIISLAIAATIQPLFAAENNHQNEIIVTATRTAQSADDSMAAVTVITRKEIDASMAATLPELLSGVVGINISTAGGIGKDTALNIRGTNADHTVVLIDGIKIGAATTGQPIIQQLTLDQIERIEIVRGIRSGLYGSEAIGGVIQIFTRKGRDEFHAHAELEAGSANHQKFAAGLSNKTGNTRYQMSASHFQTDGIHAREIKNPDLDGYINDSISVSTLTQFNQAKLAVNLNHAQGRNWYDGTTAGSDYYEDFQNQTLSMDYSHEISEYWNSKFILGSHINDSDHYTDSVLASNFLTHRLMTTWQNDLAISENQLLTLGLDNTHEDVDAVGSGYSFNKLRDVSGVFAQHQLQLGVNQINLNARHDNYTDFGKQDSGSIVLGRKLTQKLNTYLSYGTAFKAPTLNQLYSNYGNPTLKAEEATAAELGLKYRSGKQRLELSLYDTSINNLIAYDSGSGLFQQTVQARITGAEAGYSQPLGKWMMNLSATLTDPRDVITGNVLARRAQEIYKVDLKRKFSKIDMDLSLAHRGQSYDNSSNSKLLAAYNLLNLRMGYHVSNKMNLIFKGDNLLNEKYETRTGYNNPGTTYYLGLNYKM